MNLTEVKKSKDKRFQLLENLIIKTKLFENNQLAKQYLKQGKLTEKDYDWLIAIDPSKTKKYVGWLAKVLTNNNPDKDNLRNAIEEFDVLLNRGKTKTKDIFQFKTFQDMVGELKEINDLGDNLSLAELESDYETIVDNEDLLICVPHTHEASRKLGLTKFSFRACEQGKDSAWCTTYKTPNHFNNYYYENNVTFYYILVKSKKLREKIKQEFPTNHLSMCVVALALLETGSIDGYDGNDRQLSQAKINKFRAIINI